MKEGCTVKRKLLAAILLFCISLGIVLFPFGGFYRSPGMWIHRGTDSAKPVDVFLVGATADWGNDGTFETSTFLPVDRHFQSALLSMQAGLYSGVGNLYAPYYRQACLSVYYLDDPDRGPYLYDAYQDVRAAFLWYLDRYNQGRPFILAGYSQGADLALRLMEEFFDEETLQDQLVAAYLIGWRVTKEDLTQFPHLHMAQGPTDTGVIVSYNSEAPGLTGSIIVPEGGYTYGINPLNWTTDGTPADKSLNPGTVKLHMDGSADQDQVGLLGCRQDPDRGTMIVDDVSPKDYPPGEPIFVEGCYHNFELSFYYRSVQQNVRDRVQAYLNP